MKKIPYTSLATRLSLLTIFLIGIIFSIIIVVFYRYSRRQIVTNAIKHTHGMLDNMANQINSQLSIVETAVYNTVWMLEQNISTPDSLEKFLLSMVQNNSLVVGSALAFEPHYYCDKEKYFMLYASKNSDGISCSQLSGESYNYFGMDWYLIPKLLKQNHWSEPYFDNGGGEILMTTFSYPLYDDNGDVFAIFTIDVSLIQFTELVEKLKLYDSSYSFLLSKYGYYLTHPKSELILNETIFSKAFEKNNADYIHIGREMIAGRSGTTLFENDYHDDDDNGSYAFYTPIPNVGWSICNVCPHEVILRELDTTLRNILIIFCLGALLLFITTYILIKRQLSPLRGFAQSAKEIATGRFDVTLPQIKSKDEMLVLRDSFVYMQRSLNDYIIELQKTTAANQHIESELHIAREIQMGMIPKIFPPFPDREDIDLHATLKPAKEVGGDLYDFFIQDNKLYFAIGDVSGKGIPASLFMVVTINLFRTISISGYTPKQIVARMNSSISEQNESSMFVTLFVGILDLATGHLRFCNAGHNNPILIYPNGKTEYMAMETNISAGMVYGFEFVEEEIVLEPGTKLFLYTDGVVEAENPASELYSEESLIKLLTAHTKIDVQSMVMLVEQSVAEHVREAKPSDDLTMLVINYKKKQSIKTKELKMINDLREINRLEAFVADLSAELNLSHDLAMEIRLALEEIVVNIITYAYSENESDEIKLQVSFENSELTFLITDRGSAFDPTLVKDVDINLAIEDRPIGGLGVFISRQIMNEISYQRVGDKNQLRLKKRTN